MDKSGNETQNRFGEMERELAEQLESGPLEDADRERKTMAKLSPKYEIRIQTEHDPIVEETKIYRKLAREVDDKYDKYMDRIHSEQTKEE
jgi:hypothetical protein